MSPRFRVTVEYETPAGVSRKAYTISRERDAAILVAGMNFERETDPSYTMTRSVTVEELDA